jgi:hypothetical protein
MKDSEQHLVVRDAGHEAEHAYSKKDNPEQDCGSFQHTTSQ